MEKEKNELTTSLQKLMNHHFQEAKKYGAMLAVLNQNAELKVTVEEEKKKRASSIRIPSSNFNSGMITDLMQDGKKRGVSDIVNKLFPTKNGSMKVKLKDKCAAILFHMHNAGEIQRTKEDGTFQYWINISNFSDVKSKRGPRGPYKKKNKKNPVKKIPSVKWASMIPKIIKEHGSPMTIEEIVDTAFKGKHNGTKKILKSRAAVICSFYVKTKLLIRHKHLDSGRVKFSLAVPSI